MVRTLCSAIGLVLAMPITTAIAVLIAAPQTGLSRTSRDRRNAAGRPDQDKAEVDLSALRN